MISRKINKINENVVQIYDKNKWGFAVVFSSIFSNSKNLYKANALTSFINGYVSNNIFHNQYYSENNNKLYNRMKFLGEYHINIININRDYIFNKEDRHIIFPVTYKRGDNSHLESYNYNENDNDNPMLKVIVYNLTFEEFFNFDSLNYMMRDLKNTIFFFESDNWSEIIQNFYMNGIFISGGSSNQRHLFNSLDYTFSMLMVTLFGKNFTQEATNYMVNKKLKKDLFKPDFRYNSRFNIIFRNFDSIVFINEKIITFRNISRIIFNYNPILDYITPWDILRFWLEVIKENLKINKNKDFLINILNDILIMLDKDKNEDEIISFLKKNRGFDKDINKDFNTDDLKIIRDVNSSSRDEFFYKRFINKSNDYYPDKWERIKDKSLSFLKKREYHTSTSRFKEISKNKPLNISDIKLNKFLIKIEEIVNDNILDSRTKQVKLESDFLDYYQNLKDEEEGKKKKIDIKNEYILQYNERLNVLTTNNSLFRKFGNLSFLLNNINWIFLTSSILSISNKKGYNSTAINIGENIILNIFLYYKKKIIGKIYKQSNSIILKNKKFISKNKKGYEILDFFDKENIEKWENMSLLLWKKELEIDFKLILTLGDLFISLFTDELANENPIFLRRANDNNDPYIIIFNPEIDKTLINEFLDIPSNTLPMIHKPDEWKEGKSGGFLTDYFKSDSLITNPKPSSNSHETKNLDKAYDVVNQLNSIEFEINNLLLNYLINERDWFLELIKSKSENDEWVYSELTIQIAKAYSKIDKFYFNHYLDWRGRIYNSSHYLNYQGSDLGSSLLLFKKGEKLNESGKYYFYIAIANSHNENNLSKSSLCDRYNWVIFNYYKIINLDKELILKAEKPFNFLSLALSLKEYDSDNDYLIKNPIFLDATCSGIQHVSALIRDFELATLTNLNKSTAKDIPEDFYTDVINKVNYEIQDYGKKNMEYSNLINVELNRKIAKQSIMTVVYNVSIYGMKKQLESKTKKEIRSNVIIDNLFDQRTNKVYKELENKTKTRKSYLFEFPSKNKNETVLLNYKEVFMISKKLNEFIFNDYKGLGKVYFFISEIAKITNLLNLPIIWKTPNGLEFSQYYHKYKKTHAKITLYGEVKELHYLNYSNELDKRKQKNAIIPNVIHTLDATHVYEIIVEGIKNDINVITIHDCFGTHPNNMGKIHHIVRKTFILQYTNYDFLNNFRNKIIGMIKLNDYKVIEENNSTKLIYNNKEYIIPQTPLLGDFDLKQIEGSNYIIC